MERKIVGLVVEMWTVVWLWWFGWLGTLVPECGAARRMIAEKETSEQEAFDDRINDNDE